MHTMQLSGFFFNKFINYVRGLNVSFLYFGLRYFLSKRPFYLFTGFHESKRVY